MNEGLLDRINEPADLKDLTPGQLEDLCGEIRTYLVDEISNTGGHLSPNLGIVELTLAIHRSFDSPRDRVIFDVGHQAYVHKLVTGRHDFSTLRTFGGLSGYPNRRESEHDWVENSHASTALSYALGNAIANARLGNDHFTVAVIGDGALTGGMAYEALNHIAVLRPPRLVIVLNDNGRSYAPTVGGIAALAHVRFDPRYEWAKRTLGKLLRSIPAVGESADELARRLKEGFKQLIEPGTVFDAMGLKYSGTIDGHDIAAIEEAFAHARTFDEPTVVHVVTEKGRGYEPAVRDEVDKLHGVPSFDVPTGRPKNSELKLTDVAGRALVHAAREREDLIAISAAMISSTGLAEMADEFPDRVIDTGIAEQHAVTLAAGLAMSGLRPVVAIYSSFLQRAFDQITMDVALHELPVLFLLDRAGVTGPDGASHHGAFDLSYLRMIPNMVIGAPSDAVELCAMVETALGVDGPMAIRFPKGPAGSLPGFPVEPLEVGVWEELRPGVDVMIFAVGRMVEPSMKAALMLEQQGISVGVVNARWVKPMDRRLTEWARAVSHVVTIEDNVLSGGFGEGVMEILSSEGLAGKVHTIGLPDRFLPAGAAGEVLESVAMDADALTRRIAAFLA
ncbi:1-deoxy-D-xylulose-5-phosphate synthase [bacterium BMS3Abin02]|nr:1-deoxy-D-xylulose-5-phosphate synthase [bacterium BMS3Abin02]GBE20758.1 1-deoxy-D-xylulose-5-phosphate synthase [bacterium BMS3Bbin01]HDH26570.1 1-deoxy-D-xylulose-5-phosphate synthase [Actinomycetota bacterium]